MYKVLHVFSGFGGGISSLIQNLIANRNEDFIFDSLAFSYKGGEVFLKTVLDNHGKAYTLARPRTEGIPSFLHSIDVVFKENNYDAVHCHIAGWMAIPFYVFAKHNGVNTFIIHAHSTEYENKWNKGKVINVINRFVNSIIATDYFSCSDLAADFIFGKQYLRKKSFVFIPNGINLSRFSNELTKAKIEEYKTELDISNNSIVLIHIGRFNEQKNHVFILRLANELYKSNVDYVLLLVGDGELFPSVSDAVLNSPFADRIRFMGRRSDIPELIQLSDCMILPSLFEGLPTVAVECQASGRPIIMSDTISKQADLKMGLAHFCGLNNLGEWIDNIVNVCNDKMSVNNSLDIVARKGFSAEAAGIKYCKELESVLIKNKG